MWRGGCECDERSIGWMVGLWYEVEERRATECVYPFILFVEITFLWHWHCAMMFVVKPTTILTIKYMIMKPKHCESEERVRMNECVGNG